MTQRVRGYRRRRVARGITTYTQRQPMKRYETAAPWLTWRFLWTDVWTRVLGRSGMAYECLICGGRERVVLKIPRFGPVPEPPDGIHLERRRIMARHSHPGERANPLVWAKPLGNMDALKRTDFDVLDVLVAKLQEPE